MISGSGRLARRNVDLICLAGYMRLLSPFFVNGISAAHSKYSSVAAAIFPGPRIAKAALEYGVKFAGCTCIRRRKP